MKTLKSEADFNEVIKSKEAVLVYFFNDSCSPCMALRPKVIELLESEFKKMELIFVDRFEFPALSSGMGVFESPVIIGFFDTRETFRFSKYISMGELRDRISRYYNILFQ